MQSNLHHGGHSDDNLPGHVRDGSGPVAHVHGHVRPADVKVASIPEETTKGSHSRRTLFCFFVGVAVVVAAAVAIYTQVINKDDGASGDGLKIKLRFRPETGSSPSRRLMRRLLDGDVIAGGSDVTLEEIDYGIVHIALCGDVKITEYTHNGISYRNKRLDHATCHYVYKAPFERFQYGAEQCGPALSLYAAGQYVNMADQAEVDDHFNKAYTLAAGTYNYAEVAYLKKVGLKCEVVVSNGSTPVRLYSKRCGTTTCGSICCDKGRNMQECGGATLAAIPARGTGFGTQTTNPAHTVGDVWEPTPYDLFNGPSSRVFMNSKNGGDSIIVKFLTPLVIEEDAGANLTASVGNRTVGGASYNLELAYTLEGVVRGNVKPFNGGSGSASTTAFYDMSDGFYQINLAALPLTPIAYKDGEEIWRYRYNVMVRRETAVPWCMNGSSFGEGVARGSGLCHPCHHLGHECRDEHNTGAGVLNTQVYDVSAVVIDQSFDLLVDLFFVTEQGQAVDQTQVRAVSVTKVYNASVGPITRDIPFFNMLTESVTLIGSRYNFNQGLHWTRQYEIPRIRDFDILSSPGQLGKCKVLIDNQIANGQYYSLYFEVDTQFVSALRN